MSKQREALELALEVLEEINKLSIGENAICLPAEIDTAMDAIREALAEPARKPLTIEEITSLMINHDFDSKYIDRIHSLIRAVELVHGIGGDE